ncbi:MAG: 4-(cytidine 5'-diphospho)-2-C-methyl-D-erythritol kinase [Betaproteobacteria bacterium]
MDRRSRRAPTALTLKAPAKVNLTLEVVDRLPDGYHAIRSVVARLPRLADTVRVAVRDGPGDIDVRCDAAGVPTGARNLCHVAATLFLQAANRSAAVEIVIHKAIPIAAGLGGGSSDAAAVLMALDAHFPARVGRRTLASIASAIGKDVPLFLGGGATCAISGMGERVRALGPLPSFHWLIANPGVAVSTRDAYAALRDELWFMERKTRTDWSRRMQAGIRAGDANAIAAALYNDFELVVERAHPILKDLKQAMRAFGANGTLMSGSGPTVFGLFRASGERDAAHAALRAHHPSCFVARG